MKQYKSHWHFLNHVRRYLAYRDRLAKGPSLESLLNELTRRGLGWKLEAD